jgi:hypothetical protein
MKTKLSFLIVLALLATLVAAPPAQAQAADTVLLEQLPDNVDAAFADAAVCGSTFPGCTAAENFSVLTSETLTISQVQLWGAYVADWEGAPGDTIHAENHVASIRELDSSVSGPPDAYLITLTLAEPQTLAAGTYWVEIFNHGTADNYFGWVAGLPDTVGRGLQNWAYSSTAPGTQWYVGLYYDLSLRLIGIGEEAHYFTWSPDPPLEGGTATFTAAGIPEPFWSKGSAPGVACDEPWGYGSSIDLSFGQSGDYQVCMTWWDGSTDWTDSQ